MNVLDQQVSCAEIPHVGVISTQFTVGHIHMSCDCALYGCPHVLTPTNL